QLGLTVYAAYNKGTAYDPADIGLTAIPNYDRLTLNPKLYLYLSESSTLSAGINATVENRIGGDMDYVKGKGNSTNKYFEKNKTGRFSTQLEYELQIAANKKLTLRNAISYFDRSIGLPQYTFSGLQVGS